MTSFSSNFDRAMEVAQSRGYNLDLSTLFASGYAYHVRARQSARLQRQALRWFA